MKEQSLFRSLFWPIRLRDKVGEPLCPSGIITVAPGFSDEGLPEEVGILLPTNPGPARLIEQVLSAGLRPENTALGLCLASPFLNVPRDGARLAEAGFRWIANLPSVEQQDEDFTQQLADVELDQDEEISRLDGFRDLGFKTAVVVADRAGATAALEIDPEALLVLPRVADFAAGFPSLRQRGSAALGVAEAARDTDWHGLILGLAERSEVEHEALWPEPLDGVICRPFLSSQNLGAST